MKKLALGLMIAVPVALLAWTAHLILGSCDRLEPESDRRPDPSGRGSARSSVRAGGLHHHMGHSARLCSKAVHEMAGAEAISRAPQRAGASG